MDEHTLEITIKAHLKEMRARLDKAAGIAKAAETCAEAGTVPNGDRDCARS
jgi:hypothetical protein